MINMKEKLYSVASQYLSHASLVQGTLKNSEQPLTCLFVENSKVREYISERSFIEEPKTLKKWLLWIPSLKKIVSDPQVSFDLCIAVLPKRYDAYFEGLYNFRADEWVRQVIDVSGSQEEIKKRFHHRKRQISNNITTKYGLSSRISHEKKDFEKFYFDMYLPHIQKRYGRLAHIDTFQDMEKYFHDGFLLLVVSNEQAVAGALCIKKDDTLFFRRTGVLYGDESFKKISAQTALYHFAIFHAKDLGVSKVDTMKSRAFLNDGVYQTKREWGACVYSDDESETHVYYFIPRYNSKVASFFENNPAIIHARDGLSGVFGWNELASPPLEVEKKKELTKWFYAPGLNDLLLISQNSKESFDFYCPQ